MQIANTYEEYLRRKRLGEDVISLASVMGASALHDIEDDFFVLKLDFETFSIYEYKSVDGRFRIVNFKEEVSHNLNKMIDSEMLEDLSIQRWWVSVFYESGSSIDYDDYYNSLQIANGSEITFQNLLSNVSNELATFDIDLRDKIVILIGDYSSCQIIKYLCGSQFGAKDVKLLKPLPADDMDETRFAIFPSKHLNSIVEIHGGIPLTDLMGSIVRISFPMEPIVFESVVCQNITWKDIVVDAGYDYDVNNYNYKYIDFCAECDAYGNVFISCKDLLGNKELKQI